jgi:hypothetical protein
VMISVSKSQRIARLRWSADVMWLRTYQLFQRTVGHSLGTATFHRKQARAGGMCAEYKLQHLFWPGGTCPRKGTSWTAGQNGQVLCAM